MKPERTFFKTCLLCAVMLPAVVQAQFTFTTNNDGSLNIAGYTGPGGAVTIPDTTNGLTVTSIGDYAFYESFFDYNRLTSATIPNSVISIGTNAFGFCTSLTNVMIGNSVTNIGAYAFEYCSSLTNVMIGTNVTSIGKGAFEYCTGLTSITDPVSVTSMGDYVFYDCASLTNVTIGTNVTSMGDYAFYKCGSLTSVTIPDSVTSIGIDAFYGCTGLTSITIGNNVTSIGGDAFYMCGSLTSVTIPDSVTSIGSKVFYYCSNLTSVMIPNSVISIGDSAFRRCTGLTSAIIGNSVTSMGDYVFTSCARLTNVTIGTNVTSIGDYAFENCGMANITIPNSVTSIGQYAFSGCINLTSVMIPDSVTNIGSYAFYETSSLGGITVDALNPFYNSMAGVLFNKNQTTLIEYPMGMAGNYTVPNTVTNIGSGAFTYCPGLTGVYFQSDAPSADSSVFQFDNATVYYLPDTTGWGATFDGVPAVLWNPQAQNDSSFGVHNNQFGFNITGTTNIPIVVEACTSLGGAWIPLQSVSLTNGLFYFSDPQWTNYPKRFYRLRSP